MLSNVRSTFDVTAAIPPQLLVEDQIQEQNPPARPSESKIFKRTPSRRERAGATAFPALRQSKGSPSPDLWDAARFRQATTGQTWCKDLDDQKIDALVRFMNAANVRDLDGIGEALPLAFSTGHRPAFETALAVYENNVGEINEQNKSGQSCLHLIALNQIAGSKESDWADSAPASDTKSETSEPVELTLTERFECAIALGADPFITDHDGQTSINVATKNGCMEELIQAISVKLSEVDADTAMTWRDDQGRNILAMAVTTTCGHEGIVGLRKSLARKYCVEVSPSEVSGAAQTSSDKEEFDQLKTKVAIDWDGKLNDRQATALTRFMLEANLKDATPEEVESALPPALTVGHRPTFQAAREVYASGVGDINERNVAGNTCLHDLALDQTARQVWTHIDPETRKEIAIPNMSIEERLAAMLELGADPFATGEDGKLKSAFAFAKEQSCVAMTAPLSAIKADLAKLANDRDNNDQLALCASVSGEATVALCDVGAELGDYDSLTNRAAILAYYKRNPSELDFYKSSHYLKLLTHPMRGASPEVTQAFVDAVREKANSGVRNTEDEFAEIRRLLNWQQTDHNSTRLQRTLFNTSRSFEGAVAVLNARCEAKAGESTSDWYKWSDREWESLLQNYDGNSRQAVPSIELAMLLLQRDIQPAPEMKDLPQWRQLQAELPAYGKVKELLEKIERGERGIDSLTASDWIHFARHAYRTVLRSTPEQCQARCQQMDDFLRSSACSRDTRVAFLQTAYAGLQNFHKSTDEAVSTTWNQLVGNVAFMFQFKDHGKFAEEGMSVDQSLYMKEWSDKIWPRGGKYFSLGKEHSEPADKAGEQTHQSEAPSIWVDLICKAPETLSALQASPAACESYCKSLQEHLTSDESSSDESAAFLRIAYEGEKHLLKDEFISLRRHIWRPMVYQIGEAFLSAGGKFDDIGLFGKPRNYVKTYIAAGRRN